MAYFDSDRSDIDNVDEFSPIPNLNKNTKLQPPKILFDDDEYTNIIIPATSAL